MNPMQMKLFTATTTILAIGTLGGCSDGDTPPATEEPTNVTATTESTADSSAMTELTEEEREALKQGYLSD